MPKDLIVHSSQDFWVLNKPPGVPVQNDKSGNLSLLAWFQDYIKSPIHLANRIDRPVSGAVICTKRSKQTPTCIKQYIALTTKINDTSDTLEHYHKKDSRTRKAYISSTAHPDYKPCQLSYQKIKELDNYDLLQIELATGRFHQIRAQLAHIGHPIKGDVKYGARRSNKDRSVALHAYRVFIKDQNLKLYIPPLGRSSLWQECYNLAKEFSE